MPQYRLKPAPTNVNQTNYDLINKDKFHVLSMWMQRDRIHLRQESSSIIQASIESSIEPATLFSELQPSSQMPAAS